MTTIFCANCDAEAVCRVVHADAYDGIPGSPLCATCKEAYTWGQASPTAGFEDIDQPDGDDLCDTCMRSRVEISRTDEAGKTVCVDCDDAAGENDSSSYLD